MGLFRAIIWLSRQSLNKATELTQHNDFAEWKEVAYFKPSCAQQSVKKLIKAKLLIPESTLT